MAVRLSKQVCPRRAAQHSRHIVLVPTATAGRLSCSRSALFPIFSLCVYSVDIRCQFFFLYTLWLDCMSPPTSRSYYTPRSNVFFFYFVKPQHYIGPLSLLFLFYLCFVTWKTTWTSLFMHDHDFAISNGMNSIYENVERFFLLVCIKKTTRIEIILYTKKCRGLLTKVPVYTVSGIKNY